MDLFLFVYVYCLSIEPITGMTVKQGGKDFKKDFKNPLNDTQNPEKTPNTLFNIHLKSDFECYT